MSARSRLIPFVPSAITLGNLVCGFVAIALAADALVASAGADPLDPDFSQHMVRAAWVIVLGMVLDAFDGRIARLTGQTSPFGAMLDSLADMVTFGLAPAFLAKVAYEHTLTCLELPFRPTLVTSLCGLYVICAAMRLARFTVATDASEESHNTFQGLPSPAAAALLVATIFFVFEAPGTELGVLLPPESARTLVVGMLRLLPALAFLLGLLMISRVPYVHLFSRYVRHRMAVATFVKIVGATWLAALFHEWFLFLVALVYVGGGPVMAWRSRGRRNSPAADQPIAGQPIADEPIADEPITDEPITDEPITDEPITDEEDAG